MISVGVTRKQQPGLSMPSQVTDLQHTRMVGLQPLIKCIYDHKSGLIAQSFGPTLHKVGQGLDLGLLKMGLQKLGEGAKVQNYTTLTGRPFRCFRL